MKAFFNKVTVITKDKVLEKGLRKVLEIQKDYKYIESSEILNKKYFADIYLVDMDTVDVIKVIPGINNIHPESKVVILTNNVENFYRTVTIGIQGFLASKNYVEILNGLIEISNSEVYIDKRTLLLLMNNFKNSCTEDLTERERHVLKKLEEHLTYEQIAESLHIKRSTIKNHIENIYVKLNARNKYEAINKSKEIRI
ncbi:MAG: response regulator transcription factor [Fulvivirga sp.]|uniref:LuxR C-terminal-related transcriptional regulator n=1 Tax=Fulvivirga sp. TaxID=1931237 RepID=UPI003301DB82